ncbi:MAG TPA: cytochrome c3 family protein [Candidatus Polarisedimenticolia bacterium]|nr:cytochrome c3 family protein [Candidatus Polarisedimenticolia bacterium]
MTAAQVQTQLSRTASLLRRLTPALLVVLFVAAAPPLLAEQTACSDCHDDTNPAAFEASVHGGMECTDCHAGAEGVPHEEAPAIPKCADCHDDVAAQYAASIHGRARENGISEAATCKDCHGEFHAMLAPADANSPVNPKNLAGTCGRCHSDPAIMAKFGIPVAPPVEAYEASVHARAVGEGKDGATCSTCHGTHDIQAASDPRSKVYHRNVPDTCGQCHNKIADAYRAGIHWKAVTHGAHDAPVCTDCHGEHRILSPKQPGSPVYATNIPKMTCGRCHGDIRIASKYGLSTEKVASYEESYHGLASRSGVLTVANCASCHGVHGILPSSDPNSPVNKANLKKTCGRCHPGAGETFAIGTVHIMPTQPKEAAVYWVRRLYILLIIVTIGGMLLHNGFDLYRKVRNPERPPLYPSLGGEVRMLTGFRVAHAMMMISFVMLAWSGFALTYPESWWARPLLQWESQFGFRGWLHRASALVMLASLGVHIAHLIANRQARHCIAGMRPTMHDVTELREKLLWFIGRRADPPPAPKLGYPEKMEYLALMWGIAVMAVTGGLLWFEDFTLRWLPKWAADLATTIHFYEAVLASLAILVWHFYFVIFDPVVYPMDTAWLTGRSHPGRILERLAGKARSKTPHEPPPKEGPPVPAEAAARKKQAEAGEPITPGRRV